MPWEMGWDSFTGGKLKLFPELPAAAAVLLRASGHTD